MTKAFSASLPLSSLPVSPLTLPCSPSRYPSLRLSFPLSLLVSSTLVLPSPSLYPTLSLILSSPYLPAFLSSLSYVLTPFFTVSPSPSLLLSFSPSLSPHSPSSFLPLTSLTPFFLSSLPVSNPHGSSPSLTSSFPLVIPSFSVPLLPPCLLPPSLFPSLPPSPSLPSASSVIELDLHIRQIVTAARDSWLSHAGGLPRGVPTA